MRHTDEQKAAAYDLVSCGAESHSEGIDISVEQKAERWDRRAVKYKNLNDSTARFDIDSPAWCEHGRLRGGACCGVAA